MLVGENFFIIGVLVGRIESEGRMLEFIGKLLKEVGFLL